MAYFGEYSYTLDSANRLILPSRFREQLGGEIVMYKSSDGCLFVYDNLNFEKVIAPLKAISRTEVGREKLRRFYSDVSPVSVDRNGRLVVPAECIAHASLKDEVIILGLENRIEIWNKTIYLARMGNKNDLLADDYPDIEF
ncbi:MAG: division/cell wall cluster transcriptional repressor MraZ [Oscillospiraceae bacterium]|nr:division/cell wall cluster transcriptional repressor MraZ [Oscillospiraceae bacterium]